MELNSVVFFEIMVRQATIKVMDMSTTSDEYLLLELNNINMQPKDSVD